MKTYRLFVFSFLLYFTFTTFQACDGSGIGDTGLDFGVINQTTDTVTIYIPLEEEALSSIGLPRGRPYLDRVIPPNKSYGVWLQTKNNDNYFDYLPTDTLHIFILNYSIYRSQDWDSIVSNSMTFERIKITEDSLKALNYEIVIE